MSGSSLVSCAVRKLREDARADQMNNITELIRQQIDAFTLPPAPVQQALPVHGVAQSSEAIPSI